MVNFNDLQYIAGNSDYSKKIEEEALLQRLLDKKQEQQLLEKKLQEKQIEKEYATKDIRIKHEQEFKTLENISKQLNTTIKDLTSDQIKESLKNLNDTQKDIAQNILKSEQLNNLKNEHQKFQLKQKGVEQKFSTEIKLTSRITKALGVPLEQLNNEEIQKLIKTLQKHKSVNKDTLDEISKELGISKEKINIKETQSLQELFKQSKFLPKKETTSQLGNFLHNKLENIEKKQKEITDILALLKGKHSETDKVLQNQTKNIQSKLENLNKQLHDLDEQINNTLNPDDKKLLQNKKQSLQQNIQETKNLLTKNQETNPNINKNIALQSKLESLNKQLNDLDEQINKTLNPDDKQLLQNKKISLQQNIQETKNQETNPNINKNIHVQNALLSKLSQKLDKFQDNLKHKELLEKEINNEDSSELNYKLLKITEAKDEIKNIKNNIQELISNKQKNKINILNKIIKNIKNNELKSKLNNFIEKELKTNTLIEKLANGSAEELSDSEALLLKEANLEDLSETELNNFLKSVGSKIEQLENSYNSLEKIKKETKSSLKNKIENKGLKYNQKENIKEIKELLDSENINKASLSKILDKFNNLESLESEVEFTFLLRELYSEDLESLKTFLSFLVKEELIDESFLKEELGLNFTNKNKYKSQAVKEEAISILQKLTGLSKSAIENNEGLQLMINKGRIDKNILQKLMKQTISEDAWDYGVMNFSSNNLGMLKHRTEINNLINFWQLMEKFSNNPNETMDTATLFLTANKFSAYSMELISFFVINFQEFFIDPDFHLFDLYKKYLNGTTFENLDDPQKEELILAILLRLIKSLEGSNKHEKFEHIIQMSQGDENSPEFIRSVDILEYYFSCGGNIKEVYLDINKELKLFDNITEWNDEDEMMLNNNNISKMITEYSKPIKKLETVKLGRLSDRLKKKKK
jgi:hypothetical protein